jgi:uncharacterized protein YcfL
VCTAQRLGLPGWVARDPRTQADQRRARHVSTVVSLRDALEGHADERRLRAPGVLTSPTIFDMKGLPMKYHHVVTTVLMCGLFLATQRVDASDSRIQYVSSLQTIEARVVSIRETSEGPIMLLQLTNRGAAEEGALYRVNWLDESGHDVVLGEAWRPISIPAYEARSAEISAPNPSATDYRIQISVGKEFQYSSKLAPTAK